MTDQAAISHPRWSPYDWNGGTVVAVAGADYAIIAADKRLATGYSIKSRDICRVHKVSEKVMIGCGGCHADVRMLFKVLRHDATNYRLTTARIWVSWPPLSTSVIRCTTNVFFHTTR